MVSRTLRAVMQAAASGQAAVLIVVSTKIRWEGLTCVVHQGVILGVGGDERHQVLACQVELAKSEKGLSRLRVVIAQEPLQVLEAFCIRQQECLDVGGASS